MSKVKALKAIYQWVIKTMMKDQTGVMQTLPNKDLIDLNVQVTAQRLMQEGVDPTVLKNANQVENAINMIENKVKTKSGITKTKTAEVFDLEGKKIDTSKGIMGGRQIDDLPPGDPDLPPPGSRGGADDIAAPIQSEEEVLEKLSKQNKEATRNLQIKLSKDKEYQKFRGETEAEIRKRFGLDDPEDMATGGRAGFADGTFGLDVLKLEDKALDRAITAFEYYKRTGGKKDFRSYLKSTGQRGDQFRAEGGRIGFKKGMDRRTFMKVMGGLTALPILGKFFKGAKTAAPAVEKAAETVTEAPSYFFDLVSKIKMFGRQSKVGPQERVNEFSYVGKNGDEYTLTEDIVTGDARIVKDKIGGVRVDEDEVVDGIANRSVMEYKSGKGAADEGTKGALADEYDEYEVKFDYDGTEADADDMSEIIRKQIIEETSDTTTKTKKAGGGIARMLGE